VCSGQEKARWGEGGGDKDTLYIEIEINKPPVPSASGKTLVVPVPEGISARMLWLTAAFDHWTERVY